MQRKTTNGFNEHSKKEYNSKETGNGKKATYEQITNRIVFGLPPELMLKPLAIIIKQHKLKVKFISSGVIGESNDFYKMIGVLYNSVRYN